MANEEYTAERAYRISVRPLAVLFAVGGLVFLVGSLFPSAHDGFLGLSDWAEMILLAGVGIFCLFIGVGLYRRSRWAWYTMLAYFIVGPELVVLAVLLLDYTLPGLPPLAEATLVIVFNAVVGVGLYFVTKPAFSHACGQTRASWQFSLRTLFAVATIAGIGALLLAHLFHRPATQRELDDVADCFFFAVSILQREPAKGESLADFLAEAQADPRSGKFAQFKSLRWDDAGQDLISSGGHAISYRFVKSVRLRYMNRAESTDATYEFYSHAWGPRATTTVTFWIGPPPYAAGAISDSAEASGG